MARKGTARKAPDGGATELKPMDFEKAINLYRNDIKPGKSNSAAELKDVGDAYKLIKRDCYIQPASAKDGFKVIEMEESRRDDYLRGLAGIINKGLGREDGNPLVTFHGSDLVDQAEGKAPKPRSRPNLVAVPVPASDGVDADLVSAAEQVTGEAEEPAPGTSAAAIAAMRADHAKDKAEEDFDGPPPRQPVDDEDAD